jgi:EthD domain
VAPEQFHRYWREEHGPLACRLLEPLNLRRYVQTHTLDTDLNAQIAAARGTVEAFDGVAEPWWESLPLVARGDTSALSGAHGVEVLLRAVDDELRCFFGREVTDPRDQFQAHIVSMALESSELVRADHAVVGSEQK